MKNKTKLILSKIVKPVKANVEFSKDQFISKAVSILCLMPESDGNVILQKINDLGKSAKKDYHRTIITILNDKFIGYKSEKRPNVSDDIVEDDIVRKTSIVPVQNFGLSAGLQEYKTERKSATDLSSLEITIQEISALQSTLGQHLKEQSERISLLNVDADLTEQNIEMGNMELQKAIIEMSKSRAWFVYTLCILSSVLLAMDWFYD